MEPFLRCSHVLVMTQGTLSSKWIIELSHTDDWTASVKGPPGRSQGCRILAAAATEPSCGRVSRKNHEIQVSRGFSLCTTMKGQI